jgi:hypothetical protein
VNRFEGKADRREALGWPSPTKQRRCDRRR